MGLNGYPSARTCREQGGAGRSAPAGARAWLFGHMAWAGLTVADPRPPPGPARAIGDEAPRASHSGRSYKAGPGRLDSVGLLKGQSKAPRS